MGIRQALAWALRGQLDCDPIFTQMMAESGEEITIHCESVLECRYILLSRFIVRAHFSVIGYAIQAPSARRRRILAEDDALAVL